MRVVIIEVTGEPVEGDIAIHVNGNLDPREVADVRGDEVWLWLGISRIGPFPKSNYTYTRKVWEPIEGEQA